MKVPRRWHGRHKCLNPSDIEQCKAWPYQSPLEIPLQTSFRDSSRGETEGHIQYAPSNESALAAAPETDELESFRHSRMQGMALPISPRNSTSNIIQRQQQRRDRETHTICSKWWKCLGGGPADIPIWILQTFENVRYGLANLLLKFRFEHHSETAAEERQRDTYNMLQAMKVP
jgi:hypothetical protein